jgi:salicylate hydroxylase
MKIIIVGAGIGGSTLALSLAHLGIDYVLIEQAPALTTVGAGIQLSPNGVRVLEQLGLGE